MDKINLSQHGPLFLSLGVATISYVIFFLVSKFVHSCIVKYAERTETRIDDIIIGVINHTTQFFLVMTSLFIGLQFYPLTPKYDNWANKIYFVVFMWQFAIWGNHFIEKWLDRAVSRKIKRDPSAATSISLVKFISKALFLTFISLFTLHNLGIQITAMLAGLGVGGIAVALAVQNILGDLFSSLSIVLDKPFVVGDFIVLNDWQGTVEKIGLKTTRLRSLSGEQIIASNSDLLSSRIRNYKRMHERRVILNFTLSHETTKENILLAVHIVKESIERNPKLRFDRCHFTKITPTAFELEAVYWVTLPDHALHMDLQQKILIEILTSFRTSGIDMAYPTQNLNITPLDLMRGATPESDKSKSLS